MKSEVGRLYDELHLWESQRRGSSFPVHKSLTLPDGNDLLSWLFEMIQMRSGMTVLDAGCGNGHTLHQLARKVPIEGLGLTLSRAEVRSARQYVETHLATLSPSRLEFDVASFSEKRDQQFDLILAIESIRHSTSFNDSLLNLLDHLSAQGEMFLVDEFLQPGPQSDRIDRLWSGKRLPDPKGWIDILTARNYLCTIHDLTPYVKTRNRIVLQMMCQMVGVIANWIDNRNLRTYLGALLLEYQYVCRQARYLVIHILRKS